MNIELVSTQLPKWPLNVKRDIRSEWVWASGRRSWLSKVSSTSECCYSHWASRVKCRKTLMACIAWHISILAKFSSRNLIIWNPHSRNQPWPKTIFSYQDPNLKAPCKTFKCTVGLNRKHWHSFESLYEYIRSVHCCTTIKQKKKNLIFDFTDIVASHAQQQTSYILITPPIAQNPSYANKSCLMDTPKFRKTLFEVIFFRHSITQNCNANTFRIYALPVVT